ncbi:c-type cytochrome [Variovorax terrae]|uniref:C-type cytochrome n=1 Tax=Variovorax terrae TaxID=2923278 RepID=A0A9X2APJ6_9BURK|nr:c-type cytochrome [Variovorax terrae]MCJ0763582.1 c-type cytochrome [Variovorax terrae]
MVMWPSMAQVAGYPGVGRAATPAELKAWDIDVRPDFKGLPPGQGSVRRGEQVWEAQCASCHGTFGESNDVFTPMVGYTTKKDIETGHVASLLPGGGAPTRTTLMKVSQLSTLWDYIRRAMPWTAPKSLTPDDVYAVTAYILNLGNVVPDDFTLSDRNIREVQQRLPNRNGVTTAHGLWPGTELGGTRKPDVQGSACMRGCNVPVSVASTIPDYARNAHGNLAEQSRSFGSTRGADTAPPAADKAKSGSNEPDVRASSTQLAMNTGASPLRQADVMPLLQQNACVACHGMDSKLVGPSFKEVAGKYGARADAVAYLAGKIRSGGQGAWGAIPMPPQSIGEADAKRLAQWLAQGAAP